MFKKLFASILATMIVLSSCIVVSASTPNNSPLVQIPSNPEGLIDKVNTYELGDNLYDELEPNDYMDEANVIHSDYTVMGYMDKNDIDLYYFSISQETDLNLILASETSGVIAAIYDSDGNKILDITREYFEGLYISVFMGTAQAGEYYIGVQPSSTATSSQEVYILYIEYNTVCSHSYSNGCDNTCDLCGETRNVTHIYSNNCDDTCNVCGAGRTAQHSYSNSCDTSCNICGATRNVSHTFSNACDTSCNICGETRTAPHSYTNESDDTCDLCGATRNIERSKLLPGETKRIKWTGQNATFVEYTPNQSGFYNLKIADHNRTSKVFVEITDLTTDESFAYIFEEIGEQGYVSENYFMSKNHTYELAIYYSGDDTTDRLQADISLEFKKSSYVPSSLYYGNVANSTSTIDFNTTTKGWFAYTATQSGDHDFYFSNDMDSVVCIYEAQSGERIDARSTVYYNSRLENYSSCDKLVFTLEANKEYYIYLEDYSGVSCDFSIKKSSKNIKSVSINNLVTEILGLYDPSVIDASFFDYKVVYDNGTAYADYESLTKSGVDVPFVEYIGKTVEVDNETWLVAGTQPLCVTYKGESTILNVDVISVTEALRASGFDCISANETKKIVFIDYEENIGYALVKVSSTGIYEITINQAFNKAFQYCTVELVDSKNNVVKNLSNDGYKWSLISGKDYALRIRYVFDTDYTSSVMPEFSLRKDYNPLYPDTNPNGWYYDSVAYVVGAGIMSGYGNGKFGTSDSIQRQDFLIMLARLDGVDLNEYNGYTLFPDVAYDSYFASAVNWGAENGIVTGYRNGKFGVGDKVTREQLVTFLYRYADYKGYDTAYSSNRETTVSRQYTDYKNVSSFAKVPILWAIEKGVISGKTSTTIVPQGNAQRCEVAKIMYNIYLNDIF